MTFKPCYRCVKCHAELLVFQDTPHSPSTLHASRGITCNGHLEPVYIIDSVQMKIGLTSKQAWEDGDWLIEPLRHENAEQLMAKHYKGEGDFVVINVYRHPTRAEVKEAAREEDRKKRQ